MKIVCNPQELSDALNIVSKALSTKPTIPVLEGIRLEAKGSTLTVSATDLELFIEKKINTEILLEGELVVVGRIFTDFIRKLIDIDKIIIEKTGDVLTIFYGENETKIQCLSYDTYPEMPKIGGDKSFSIKEVDLKDVLDKTLFCVLLEDSRPILKGCNMVVKDAVLTTVALDGYRLAVCKTAITEQEGNVNIVVLGKTLLEISRIFTESEDNVKVNIQNNNIMFDLGHTKMATRLIEGDFLDYERTIPKEVETSITVNKNEFENGLERASLISRDKKSGYTRLSISNDNIIMKCNSDVGNFRENVCCKIEGKDVEIAFNSKYLFDAFNHIKEDYIKINLKGSNTPAIIQPLEGDKFKYIILPVRLIG